MGTGLKSPSSWVVEFHDEFEAEFAALDDDVQDNLLAAAKALQIAGPKAGRPHVDTLAGSKHVNMKELRFDAHDGNEEWRAAFAFDPNRRAIILVAGAKQGKSGKRFYKQLISLADERFDSHLKATEAAGKRKE
jgi:hypothetical protein